MVSLLAHARGVMCRSCDTVAIRDRLTASAADANGLGSVIDITSAQGAMTILGRRPARCSRASRRSTCARRSLRVHACRPGSVARTGGAILCEAPDRYLMLFGAALGQYVWTLVDDAARHLGGGPIGAGALPPLEAPHA